MVTLNKTSARAIALTSVAGLALVGLAACSGSSESAGDQAAASASESASAELEVLADSSEQPEVAAESTNEESTESAPTPTDEGSNQVTEEETAESSPVDVSGVDVSNYSQEPEAGTQAALAWEALMGPEGEYAASASYLAVIDEFGPVQPYVMIQEAEERHANALIRQLEGFGVAAPDNPYLGNLAAPADLESAAQAWAEGEVLNVALYDELLAETTDNRLERVFTNLRRASLEAHLPMFEAAAESGGTLTDEQLADLGHGDHEQGGGQGQGHDGDMEGDHMGDGHGPGMGKGNGNGQGRGRGQGV